MGDHSGWFDWAYKGVDHSFPGNGGLECRDFLSLSQRWWESIIASLVAFGVLFYAVPRLRLPCDPLCGYSSIGEPLGKRLLLLLMCLTFGIELGFKLATRQMIWIGNPCHLTTMMQIFILAAPPSRIVTAAFRLHLHMLTGAPIAILFPVINTRLLPFETAVYFLQHILMLIIPFYLMKTGDPFIPEKLLDFNWSLVSFGFLFIYHFLPLQMLAYVSQVNLNNMLCPAVSDPFHGKYYRLFAIAHQIILIPTLGKVFILLAKAFRVLPEGRMPQEAPVSQVFHNSPPMTRDPCVLSPCCLSSDSCENNSDDFDSGYVNDNRVRGRSREEIDDASGCSSNFQCQGATGEEDLGRTRSCAGCRRANGEAGCAAVDSSGENQAGFVTRRLVNGQVTPCQDSGMGHSSPKLNSCSCATLSSNQAKSGARMASSDRPMTMSELSPSNGHAKTH